MMHYCLEFAGLMAVFSLFIVAPGADFAVVVRQAVVGGRRAAIITSFGIGCALLFHITYTILGLGLVISKSLLMFNMLKWLGAAYLIWLGVRSWRDKAPARLTVEDHPAPQRISLARSFGLGFVTNALNPKPVMFFLSLFSALVGRETPIAVEAIYGVLMSAALIAWFVLVANFFTLKIVRDRFTAFGGWFNRVSGVALIALGLKLAVASATD